MNTKEIETIREALLRRLLRLEQDDYGMCKSCGVSIGIGRLKVNPSATCCINCA